MATTSSADLLITELRHLISDHFSLQEVQVLAIETGLDYEEFGEGGKSAKIIALLQHAQQRSLLERLVEVARQERPFLPWPAAAETDIPCPYRGLFAFREQDAHLFFGRERFTEQLLGIVGQRALTAVIGPSGSGKSSVIFAGLIPELRKQGKWSIMQMRPSNNPFSGLASALLPFYAPELNETDRLLQSRKLALVLQDGSLTLPEVISLIEKKQTETSQTMLIIDQFEELYTLTPDNVREQFLDLILDSDANAPSILQASSFRLLLTLRADFMGQVLANPEMVNALQSSDVKLGPMDNPSLRRVIEEPAKLAGVRFETGLVDRIIDDVGGENSTLPLLEFALTELWKWQSNRELTHVAYEKIGQVRGALALHAEQVFASLSPEEQDNARRVMVQLVQPGRGVADTRRVAQRTELQQDWDLVQRLASVRLLVTNQDEQGQTAEVIHEALIQRWDNLQNWMNEDRAFRQWQERLRFSLQYYEEIEHDEGALLRGAPLAEAEGWVKERFDDVSDEEVDFILASARYRDRDIAAREEQQREALALAEQLAEEQSNRADAEAKVANRTGRVAWAIGLAMVAALAAGIFTYMLNTVSHTRAVAGQAEIAFRQGNYEQAMRLALDASNRFEREDWLHARFSRNDKRIYLNNNEALLREIPLFITNNATDLVGHSFFVGDVAWSKDDQLASVASDVIIWDLDEGIPEQIIVSETGLFGGELAWSPDQKQIAALDSSFQTIEIWNVETKNEEMLVQLLSEHGADITDLAWSDEGILASSDEDGIVIFWDVASGTSTHILDGHEGAVYALDWSENGRLATASADETIIIWDGETGEEIRTLRGHHTDELQAVAWSEDGRIASGGIDLSVLVWDLEQQEEGIPPLRLEGHSSIISGIDWSPDGELASSSSDGEVILWNLETKLPDQRYRQTAFQVFDIQWSNRGHRLAAANDDDIVTVFDVNVDQSAKTLKVDDSEIRAVAWSPSGVLASGAGVPRIDFWTTNSATPFAQRDLEEAEDAEERAVMALDWNVFNQLAAGSADGTVTIWSDSGELVAEIVGHESRVLTVDWSPAGVLASGDVAGDVHLWELGSYEETRTLDFHEGTGVQVVDWSSSGRLASGGTDGRVAVWDSELEQPTAVLDEHGSGITALAWSPLGQLATGSIDGKLVVWDAALTEPTVLSDDAFADRLAGVASLAWSPDGRLISGASDGRITTWDVAAGVAEQTLREKSFPVNSLSWSNDGLLAAAYPDGTITLIADFATRAPCDWLPRNYSEEEWIQVHSQLRTYTEVCENIPTPPFSEEALTWRGRAPRIALAILGLVALYFVVIVIWNYIQRRRSGMRPTEAILNQQHEIFERLRGLTTREESV